MAPHGTRRSCRPAHHLNRHPELSRNAAGEDLLPRAVKNRTLSHATRHPCFPGHRLNWHPAPMRDIRCINQSPALMWDAAGDNSLRRAVPAAPFVVSTGARPRTTNRSCRPVHSVNQRPASVRDGAATTRCVEPFLPSHSSRQAVPGRTLPAVPAAPSIPAAMVETKSGLLSHGAAAPQLLPPSPLT